MAEGETFELARAASSTDEPIDGGAKRRQVMDGARAVFMKDGFDGASMNDIARAAGVSKGTLYAYFESKERLFEALIREDKAQQAERLCNFSGLRDDPAEFLTQYGRRLVEMLIRPEHIAQVRTVIACCGKFPNLGRAFYESGPCFGAKRLAAEIEAFVQSGALIIDDCLAAAQQFLDMSHGSMVKPVLFGASSGPTADEIDKSVARAVMVFMAAYGAKRRG